MKRVEGTELDAPVSASVLPALQNPVTAAQGPRETAGWQSGMVRRTASSTGRMRATLPMVSGAGARVNGNSTELRRGIMIKVF